MAQFVYMVGQFAALFALFAALIPLCKRVECPCKVPFFFQCGKVVFLHFVQGGLLKWEELQSQLDRVTQILQTLQQSLQTPVNEPGNGSPSAFQAALLTALGTLQLPDYSQVESDKVLHGAGSSTGTDGNSVAGSGQESQASGDQEGSTLGDQNSDTVGIFELET